MLKKIFWLLFLLPINALAIDVSGLYQAEIEVADQGQQERTRAIIEGFRQVVVKVTGSRSAGANQTVRSLAEGAGRFVQQYKYQVKSTAADARETGEKTFLVMTFDSLAVNQLLRDAGLPVWGSQRPQILAWVGIEANGNRRLMSPELDQEVVNLIKQQAFNRGISILFPLMDIEDQSALSASDLWGAFDSAVINASQRYSPDLVAIIRLKMDSNKRISSSWSLLDGGDSRRWEHNAPEVVDVTIEGVNDMADALALQYAPAGGSQSEMVFMQVENVNSFAGLVSIQKMLKDSATVDEFELRSAAGDKVVFAMKLRGGIQSFTRAMAISGVMTEAQPAIFNGSGSTLPLTSSLASSLASPSQPGSANATAVSGQPLPADQSAGFDPEVQIYYRLL